MCRSDPIEALVNVKLDYLVKSSCSSLPGHDLPRGSSGGTGWRHNCAVPMDSPVEQMLLRALVAEDDPAIRSLMADLLILDGWEVKEAKNGSEAIDLAEHWHPDALVMDVMMPGVDGLDAVEAIRQQPGNDDCAVVVVTAKPEARERAEAMHVDEFISKPFEPDELSAKTRAALRGHRAHGDA